MRQDIIASFVCLLSLLLLSPGAQGQAVQPDGARATQAQWRNSDRAGQFGDLQGNVEKWRISAFSFSALWITGC